MVALRSVFHLFVTPVCSARWQGDIRGLDSAFDDAYLHVLSVKM